MPPFRPKAGGGAPFAVGGSYDGAAAKAVEKVAQFSAQERADAYSYGKALAESSRASLSSRLGGLPGRAFHDRAATQSAATAASPPSSTKPAGPRGRARAPLARVRSAAPTTKASSRSATRARPPWPTRAAKGAAATRSPGAAPTTRPRTEIIMVSSLLLLFVSSPLLPRQHLCQMKRGGPHLLSRRPRQARQDFQAEPKHRDVRHHEPVQVRQSSSQARRGKESST